MDLDEPVSSSVVKMVDPMHNQLTDVTNDCARSNTHKHGDCRILSFYFLLKNAYPRVPGHYFAIDFSMSQRDRLVPHCPGLPKMEVDRV